MSSEKFREKCKENMNKHLHNYTNDARRILSYDSFNVVSIYNIDPLNYTITTTEVDDELLIQ